MTYLTNIPKPAAFPGSSSSHHKRSARQRWQARLRRAASAGPVEMESDPIDRALPRRLRRDGWWLES